MIRIGTRNSKLALWQTNYVCKQLEQLGIETEIIPIETKGDKILDVSISKIGSKGVFTEELEQKLRQGDIDVAIHSAKDLQSNLDNDLEIIAFSPRENPQDVLVSDNENLDLAKGHFRIGTSSTRRIALLKNLYPNVRVVDSRGNLQTRIAKMQNGTCDALLLAYAGISRLGYGRMVIHRLDTDHFVPAVGQGSIAVQASTQLATEKKIDIRKTVNDRDTEICIKAERAFLKKLEGGCSIPVFGLARLSGYALSMKAGIISLDGKRKIDLEASGNADDPEKLGGELADKLLSGEGGEILAEIKRIL